MSDVDDITAAEVTEDRVGLVAEPDKDAVAEEGAHEAGDAEAAESADDSSEDEEDSE